MRRLILIFTVLGIVSELGAQNCDTNIFNDGKQYYDTYFEFAPAAKMSDWAHFNAHDPSVYKDGDWYYMYSTDASWGGQNNNGALKRRSKDLVNWEFLGTAFDGVPQSAQDFFKIHNSSYTDQGIWAPFLFKYKDGFILYYSAPGGLDNQNLAFIGYATSNSADGPWEDQGEITTSIPGDTINAIDPSLVYDSVTNKLWMSYGSWFTGIYVVEMDTATGGIKTVGDRGKRIATRKSGGGLEGADLIYKDGWYYIFLSYDPLGDIYNVRVGRSKTPDGSYLDFNGVDMATNTDNTPMILSPYRFNNHCGWQGTAHCGVYNDNGTFYMFNQGRPSIDAAQMVLHVRKLYWMNDWPVASPQRYAGVPECEVATDSLIGKWEHIPLIYSTSATNFHSTVQNLELNSDGTFNSTASNTWTRIGDTLTFSWNNGQFLDKVIVFWGWDWEYNRRTVLYSGINADGLCLWGKKVNQSSIDKYTKIVSGAVYQLRNHYSNMLMEIPNGNFAAGTSIKQGLDKNDASQAWRILDAGDGYYTLMSIEGNNNLVAEIVNGTNSNGIDLRLGSYDGLKKQLFKLNYLNDGYYSILTKISENVRCIDLNNFSIEPGGNFFQWEYLNGINQKWRIMRIDSIAIDTTIAIIPSEPSGISNTSIGELKIFPNPSPNGDITISLKNIESTLPINVAIYSYNGMQVYSSGKLEGSSNQEIQINLPTGIYITQVKYGSEQKVDKLIVY